MNADDIARNITHLTQTITQLNNRREYFEGIGSEGYNIYLEEPIQWSNYKAKIDHESICEAAHFVFKPDVKELLEVVDEEILKCKDQLGKYIMRL